MNKMKKLTCLLMVFIFLISGISSVAAANPLGQWYRIQQMDDDIATGLFGAAYGDGTFMVTKAGDGKFLISTNGNEWSEINTYSGSAYIDVEYGNGTFVAAGYNGSIVRSTDAGTSWVLCSSPPVGTLRGLAYGNNTFMVVGDNRTVLYSLNSGSSWSNTLEAVPASIGDIYSVAYGDGKFVIIGTNGVAVTDYRGLIWTEATGNGDITSNLSEAVYGNGLFVAVGAGGKVVSSTDGVSWAAVSSPTSTDLYSVNYGNNCFVAVGANGIVITSPDGVNWTDRTITSGTDKNLYNVTWGKNTFVAVGAYGTIIQSAVLSGDITGTVTNGSQPVIGVDIELYTGGLTYSAVTADDGTYLFTSIPGGRGYTVTANKTGYNIASVNNINIVPGVTTSSVDLQMTALGAQTATAAAVISSPIAGAANTVNLSIKDFAGITDTSISDTRTVTISGITAAPDGSYGSFNGTTLTAGTQAVPVNFISGVASPSLQLNNATAQSITFSISDVANPNTGPITITPVSDAKASIKIMNNITAPTSNGGAFSAQPVIAITDAYGNICTSDNSTQVTVSKKDPGAWTLTGTTTQTAINGIVTFTGLRATNAAQVANAQLAFNSTGLAEITSAAVTLPAPAPAVVNNSSSVSDTVTPISKISVAAGTDAVTATLSIDAKTDFNGKTLATVTEQQLRDTVNRAIAEAAKATNKAAPKVEIKISAPADAKEVQTALPEGALNDLGNSNIVGLELSTPLGTITFDKNSIKTIADGTADGVKVTVSKVAAETLKEDAKQKVGNRPVYNFGVTNTGGDKTISNFGGDVTVKLAYTPQPGEDVNAIVIYYINSKGELETVSNGVYDPKTGTVSFTTNHFSTYAVGYNKVSYSDVTEKDWFYKAVQFIVARDISSNIASEKYSPNTKLTRGEYIVMLMKAYGIAPDTNSVNNFSDAGNSYYTGYLAAAKRLGITGGVGNNKYAPEKQITRQEVFTLLYNALKVMNKLPNKVSDKKLETYSDVGSIANWAKEAMTLFVQAEIISGSKNKLNATATMTRAEMAQVLYNLMNKNK